MNRKKYKDIFLAKAVMTKVVLATKMFYNVCTALTGSLGVSYRKFWYIVDFLWSPSM